MQKMMKLLFGSYSTLWIHLYNFRVHQCLMRQNDLREVGISLLRDKTFKFFIIISYEQYLVDFTEGFQLPGGF